MDADALSFARQVRGLRLFGAGMFRGGWKFPFTSRLLKEGSLSRGSITFIHSYFEGCGCPLVAQPCFTRCFQVSTRRSILKKPPRGKNQTWPAHPSHRRGRARLRRAAAQRAALHLRRPLPPQVLWPADVELLPSRYGGWKGGGVEVDGSFEAGCAALCGRV